MPSTSARAGWSALEFLCGFCERRGLHDGLAPEPYAGAYALGVPCELCVGADDARHDDAATVDRNEAIEAAFVIVVQRRDCVADGEQAAVVGDGELPAAARARRRLQRSR
jgi:hypothetical protein